MSQAHWQNELRIPAALRSNSASFAAACGRSSWPKRSPWPRSSVLAAYLSVFALDRLFDTPSWLRAGIGVAALVGCCVVPWCLHRWVWRFHRLEQLARLLSRKMPGIGDQLLGILELAENRWEQSRSLALCQAAIEQVSEDARTLRFPRRDARFARAILDRRRRDAVVRRHCWPPSWLPRRPKTPGPDYCGHGAIRRVTPSPPSSRCRAELIVAHGEPFTLTANLGRNRAGGRHMPAHRLPTSRRSTPSSPTAATNSNCRRRSMPARCGSASATPPRKSRSSPSCGPS